MGAIALFIVLAIVMYVTRKIDWYARDSGKASRVPSCWKVTGWAAFCITALSDMAEFTVNPKRFDPYRI